MTFGVSAYGTRLSAFALSVCCVAASAAHATLGGSYASVETDRARMAARHVATPRPGFVAHTLAPTPRMILREYTRPDGRVFAIAWQGPGRPDLRQALGRYFQMMNADSPARVRGARRPLAVNRADFVLSTGGHPGGMWGVAYLPSLMPAGVTPDDIK